MKTPNARLFRRLGWLVLAALLTIYWSGCASAPPPPPADGKMMVQGASPIQIKKK
jgi:hypothetical protein